MSATVITLLPVDGMPQVVAGDDLGALIAGAVAAQSDSILPGDIVVITSKIVSKAENRYVQAHDRAELVLDQSTAVVSERRTSTGMTRVVAARSGPVMAGAGIDTSNSDDDRLLLLPPDPDASARRWHAALAAAVGHGDFGVILSDTSGRPWRQGLTDFALGAAGVQLLDDLRGHADTAGRDLAVTVRNLADAIAAGADLVKGKLDNVPVAIVRGLAPLVVAVDEGSGARELVRSGPADWFALGQVEAVRSALGVLPGSPAAYAIGIASVHPEPLADRVERVLGVASHGEPQDNWSVTLAVVEDRARIVLRAADPVLLGRLWARIEAASASELLRHESVRADDEVRIVIRSRS